MHLNAQQSRTLAERVESHADKFASQVNTVIFPSAINLSEVKEVLKSTRLGVQNVYHADEGPFTGEISAAQAVGLAEYAIVGHSERRHLFHETDEMIARKAASCLRNEITPIVCVGETQHEREEKETVQVLNDQVGTGLTMLTAQDVENSVIAYEPVWAIGSSNNARPEDVNSAVDTIRRTVAEMFGEKTSKKVQVLYGGSVDKDTAVAYLNLDAVDGLLVGGASLNDHEFSAILERAASGKK